MMPALVKLLWVRARIPRAAYSLIEFLLLNGMARAIPKRELAWSESVRRSLTVARAHAPEAQRPALAVSPNQKATVNGARAAARAACNVRSKFLALRSYGPILRYSRRANKD